MVDFMLWQADDNIALFGEKLVFSLVVCLRLLEAVPVVAVAFNDDFVTGQIEVAGIPSNRVLLPKGDAHFGQETSNGTFDTGALAIVSERRLMRELALDRTVYTLFCSARLQHHGFAAIQAGDFDLALTALGRAILLAFLSAWVRFKFFAARLASLFYFRLAALVVGTVLWFEHIADKAKAGTVFLFISDGTTDTKRFAASDALLFYVRQAFVRLRLSVVGIAAFSGAIFSLRPCISVCKKCVSAFVTFAGDAIYRLAVFVTKGVFRFPVVVIISEFLAARLTLARHEKPPVGWLDVLAEGTTARQEAMKTISGCKPTVKRNVPSALVIIAHACGKMK